MEVLGSILSSKRLVNSYSLYFLIKKESLSLSCLAEGVEIVYNLLKVWRVCEEYLVFVEGGIVLVFIGSYLGSLTLSEHYESNWLMLANFEGVGSGWSVLAQERAL